MVKDGHAGDIRKKIEIYQAFTSARNGVGHQGEAPQVRMKGGIIKKSAVGLLLRQFCGKGAAQPHPELGSFFFAEDRYRILQSLGRYRHAAKRVALVKGELLKSIITGRIVERRIRDAVYRKILPSERVTVVAAIAERKDHRIGPHVFSLEEELSRA